MGLNTTHGCGQWNYVEFGLWRREIAKVADIRLELLAERLAELLLLLPERWQKRTQVFIDGLLCAHAAGEDVSFS